MDWQSLALACQIRGARESVDYRDHGRYRFGRLHGAGLVEMGDHPGVFVGSRGEGRSRQVTAMGRESIRQLTGMEPEELNRPGWTVVWNWDSPGSHQSHATTKGGT